MTKKKQLDPKFAGAQSAKVLSSFAGSANGRRRLETTGTLLRLDDELVIQHPESFEPSNEFPEDYNPRDRGIAPPQPQPERVYYVYGVVKIDPETNKVVEGPIRTDQVPKRVTKELGAEYRK